jgi:hypothetical protein
MLPPRIGLARGLLSSVYPINIVREPVHQMNFNCRQKTLVNAFYDIVFLKVTFNTRVYLKPRPHLRKMSADTYPLTQSENVRGLSTYCTQTSYLYAKSVCCLPARVENSRKSMYE